MGMYFDWKTNNPATNSEKQVVNVEFVLKTIENAFVTKVDLALLNQLSADIQKMR